MAFLAHGVCLCVWTSENGAARVRRIPEILARLSITRPIVNDQLNPLKGAGGQRRASVK